MSGVPHSASLRWRRVESCSRRLDYRPDLAATRLARARAYSLCFVRPKGSNSFVALLADQVRPLGPWLAEQRTSAHVENVDVFSAEAVARQLASLNGRRDAVIVMALDHPQVRGAIDDLVAGRTQVVTLVSDVPASRRANREASP